jgi:hypothetical protein
MFSVGGLANYKSKPSIKIFGRVSRTASYQVTDFHLEPQYPEDAMSTYLLHQYVGAASERERLGIHPPMLVGYQILLT